MRIMRLDKFKIKVILKLWRSKEFVVVLDEGHFFSTREAQEKSFPEAVENDMRKRKTDLRKLPR